MKKNNPIDLLKENIAVLKFKQEEDLAILKWQLETTFDSLKPQNLLKSAIMSMTSVTGLKNNLVSNAIGLTTGYLSKKIILGDSHNPVKKILGSILQFIITNVVAKKTNTFQLKNIKE